MGVITTVDREVDEEARVTRLIAVTKWDINTVSALNRVAGRMAIGEGVGQRTLVASAYDELGLDLVWNKGLGITVPPEEKYPDAKKINYTRKTIDQIDNTSDIYNLLTAQLRERVDFGEFRSPEYVMHVWEVPFDL